MNLSSSRPQTLFCSFLTTLWRPVALGTLLLTASCATNSADENPAPQTAAETPVVAGGLLADGVYTLTSKLVPTGGGASQRLDVAGGVDQNGQQVGVWNQNSLAPQQWRLVHQGSNLYTLTSQVGQKNKQLDADSGNGGIKQGSRVQIYASGQRWLLEDAGSGYVYLTPEAVRNSSPKLRLDVAGGITTLSRYTTVHLWPNNGNDAQKWKLEAVAGGGSTTPPPSSGGAVSGPPAGTGSWTQTFADNFDTFDAGKWVKRWACGNGQALGCTYQDRLGTAYEDANVYVANGLLNIKTERKATRGNAFTSGVITTGKAGGFMQKYGYFEVRMKPASSPGNDPCFWAFPLSKPSATPFKELDFAEFGGRGGVVALTSHMPGQPDASFSKTGDWAGGFHTYGVLWEADKAVLYIDGVEQGRITRSIVDEAGVLILSDEVRKDDGGWFGNSDNFQGPVISQIDWVRVWQKN